MVAPLAGTAGGAREFDRGAGGDRTMELDRQAEGVAIEVLEGLAATGVRFSLLSEELGHRDYGAAFPLVLLDPVDGSLNAKRGLPIYACMLTLLEGPTLAHASVGHIRNLVTGTDWSVIRGHGAQRDGASLQARPAERGSGLVEVLGLESTPGSWARVAPILDRVTKVRIIGSMALSIAHTGAGEIDLFCAPLPSRLFDMTAGLILLAELGGMATDLDGRRLDLMGVDLAARTTLLASSSPEVAQAALAGFVQPAG